MLVISKMWSRLFGDKKTLEHEIDSIPKKEWAKIWCSLNSWKIPTVLNHIKPSWWDGSTMGEKSEFISPIMRKIEIEIGHKACNREWNRERMTDQEHEDFWRNKGF